MIWLVLSLLALTLLVKSIHSVQPGERAIVLRSGNPTRRIVGSGVVLIIPFLDSLRRVSIEPLSLSLPIQSAITRDEIPIQLQASLDAEVKDPTLALTGARDWRVQLISQLQLLMKDRLEELDFGRLDESFPEWTNSIRKEMEKSAVILGIEIKGLSISNLSPRSRPE